MTDEWEVYTEKLCFYIEMRLHSEIENRFNLVYFCINWNGVEKEEEKSDMLVTDFRR